MPGGTCEATLYQLGGRRSCGISIPLGNYHNSTNRGVAPEYVSLADLRGVVDLLWDLAVQKEFARTGQEQPEERHREGQGQETGQPPRDDQGRSASFQVA